jgi:5-methyltetrahydrofolate--homocysteine methyltransferase
MSKYPDLEAKVLDGDIDGVVANTKKLLDAGENPLSVINDGLISGINEVGERFKRGELYVPEMMMSAQAMKAGVELVKPLLASGDLTTLGTVVLGTVKGDLHDIGKNLVLMMLESSGFTVIDLGVDVEPERFVAAVKEHQANIVAMSALLTTTMPTMKAVIDILTESGLRSGLKVAIGGAPVSQAYADQIGADGYASDAGAAVSLCKELVA